MLESFFATVGIFLASIFGGPPVDLVATVPSQPAAVVAAFSNEDAPINVTTSAQSTPPSDAMTTIVKNYITQPVIERTIQPASLAGYVTREDLAAEIDRVTNSFAKIINGSTYPAPTFSYSNGGVWNAIALTNRIEHLSGTSLSDITVDGVSGLTTSDIPDLSGSYLSISSGTSTSRINIGFDLATSTASYGTYNIAAWGDSLTAGNEDGTGVTYPGTLSTNLGGRPVYNGGVGGETTTQIEARMLAASGKSTWTVVIWAGRNDLSLPAQVKSNIDAMVQSLGTNTHYVILSVINGSGEGTGSGNYNNIAEINAYLSATYPAHYLDIRTYLVSQYDPLIPQDVTDHANDIPPTSLRYDTVHLNAAGYQLVAQQVANFIQTMDATVQTTVLTPSNLPSIFASPFSIGTVNQPAGFFSTIGIATTSTSTPSHALDVYGSVNIAGAAGSYKVDGLEALVSSSTAGNVAVGPYALIANTSGINNNAFGKNALSSNTSGHDNNVIGKQALTTNLTGNNNVAIGSYALRFSTVSNNIGIGYQAGTNISTGANNIWIGNDTLANGGNSNLTTGSKNIAIGYNISLPSGTGSNQLNVGNLLYGTGLDGSGSGISTGNIGVGTTTPYAKFSIHANTDDSNTTLFAIASSTASATTTLFSITNAGNVSANGNITFGTDNTYDLGANGANRARDLYMSRNVFAGGSGALGWASRGRMTAASDGVFTFQNNAQSDFSRLQFGGTTSSFPALGRSGTTLYVTLADGTAGGSFGVATSTPWRTLSVTGTVGFDGLTGSTGAGSLCLDSNKQVVYNSGSDACLSSTRATKHDIQNLNLNALTLVESLQPVSFVYNNDASSTVRYGFIAEDTAAVDTHLTTYDASGNISGIDDRSIIAIVVDAIRHFADVFTTKELTFVRASGDELTVKKLCVEDVCVTRDQFLRMVEQGGQAPAQSSPTPSEPDEPQVEDAPLSPSDESEPPDETSDAEIVPEVSDAPPIVPADTPEEIPATEPDATTSSN